MGQEELAEKVSDDGEHHSLRMVKRRVVSMERRENLKLPAAGERCHEKLLTTR